MYRPHRLPFAVLRRGLGVLGESDTLRQALTSVPLTRAMSRRFVAGETLDDFVRAARAAREEGLRLTGNFLGEDVTDPEEACMAAATYLRTLDRLHDEALEVNVSVKPSQFGADPTDTTVVEHLDRIVSRARELEGFVRIDMESSALTRPTLELFETLHPGAGEHVGVVLQAYLKRSAGDVQRMIELGAKVRLCKGAYDESTEIAYRNPDQVRESFRELAERLLADGYQPAIATHDEALLRHVIRYARSQAISPDRFEFQMLYGVRRDLQRALLDRGYRVRVYIPFGVNWYPYLMRRLAERPENMWFMVRSLVRESPLGGLLPGERGLGNRTAEPDGDGTR